MNVNPQKIARVAIYGAFVGGLVVEAVAATRILTPSKRNRKKSFVAPSFPRVPKYTQDYDAHFNKLLDSFNQQITDWKFDDIVKHY